MGQEVELHMSSEILQLTLPIMPATRQTPSPMLLAQVFQYTKRQRDFNDCDAEKNFYFCEGIF